ncbi:60S ribosomal protein L18-B [Termitomyces sp. T112]|nr:60S ribosomal protein L18-B [Termitomyces sp. T112]
MSIPKTLFPNIRDDSLGIKAVPFATLTKPEQVWTTPSSPPIDTWTERVKRLISTNANLGEGEEPLEVAPILLHSTKENAIPMSFINATSKKRTSNKKVIRVKIASRLKIAINLIVTRGADVAEVNGKLKLVMNEEEAVKMSDKWLSPGWTYIFFPTLEIYRMPYHDMIPLLRKSLRQIYDLSQEFEKKWVSNATKPKEAPKSHYTPNHAKAFYQHTGKTTPGKPFQNRNTRQMGYRPYSTRSNPTTQSRSAKDNLDAKPHKGKKKKSHNKSQSSECLCPRSRRSNRFDKVPTLVPELEESISVQMSEFSPTAERGVTSATLEAKPHKGKKKKSHDKSQSSERLSSRCRRSNKFDEAPTLVPELEGSMLAQMIGFSPTAEPGATSTVFDAKPHKGKKKKSHDKSQSSERLSRSRRSDRFDKAPTLVPELEESMLAQMNEYRPTAERGATSAIFDVEAPKGKKKLHDKSQSSEHLFPRSRRSNKFDKAPTLVPMLEESMLAQMNELSPTAERGATSAIFDVGAHKDKKKSYNKSRSSEHLSPRSRRSNKFDAAPTLVPELEERILAQMSEFDPTAEPGATSTILDVKPHKGGKKKSHNKYQSSERLSVRSRRSNKFDEAPTLVPELEESILAQMSEFDPTSEPGATSTVRLDDVAYENTFPTSILGNDIPKIIPAIREDDPTIIMLKELRDEATQWLGRSSKLYTSKRRQGFIRRRIIAQQGKPEATLDLEFIGFDSRPNPSYDPFTGVQASSRPQEDPISTHKTLLDLLNTRSARTSPRHPEYPRYGPLPPHDFDPFAPLISLEEKQHASTFRTKSADKSLSDFSDALNFDPSAPVSPASAPKLEVELTAPNNLPAKTRSVENLVQEFNPFCTEDLDGGIIATPTPATPISPLTSGPRPRPSTSSRISRLKRAETQARAF